MAQALAAVRVHQRCSAQSDHHHHYHHHQQQQQPTLLGEEEPESTRIRTVSGREVCAVNDQVTWVAGICEDCLPNNTYADSNGGG